MGDSKEFPKLIRHLQTKLGDVYADAAYLSNENCWQVAIHGGTPYICTKSTTKRVIVAKTPFQEMIKAYQGEPVTWKKKYGKRNRVESVFGAVKRRFGSVLAAVSSHGLRIEACLKLIAWNLTRVPYT